MANAVVTSTANTIKVTYNDMEAVSGIDNGCYAKAGIDSVSLHDNLVEVVQSKSVNWVISNAVNSNGYIVIDTIDGVSVSSLEDLYNKITALIA